jgi:hypothetical protein
VTTHDERRAFQRLNLTRPLDGWFGEVAVRVLDVSASGALIDLDEPLDAETTRGSLEFFWNGEEVEVIAAVARRDDLRLGLRFLEENETLRRFIGASVKEMLTIDVEPTPVVTAEPLGEPVAFVTWSLTDKGWHRRASLLPEQPTDGFTIASTEPEEEVAMLMRTYEHGDAEARRLTRLLAELSVVDGRQ